MALLEGHDQDVGVLKGLRIVLVEDDQDSRDMLADILASYGCEVVAAAGAAEGFAETKRANPDVFITDIGLPDEDGYTLLGRVRALPRSEGGGVLAIALTGYDSAAARARMMEVGFDMHFTKPIRIQQFLVALIERASVRVLGPSEGG